MGTSDLHFIKSYREQWDRDWTVIGNVIESAKNPTLPFPDAHPLPLNLHWGERDMERTQRHTPLIYIKLYVFIYFLQM